MKRKKTIETGFRLLFLICGLIAVAFVLLISIYLIIAGIPAIREVELINYSATHGMPARMSLVSCRLSSRAFTAPQERWSLAYR